MQNLSFEKIKELNDQYIQNTYGRLPLAFSHGKGAYIYSTDGREFLDFLAGISVTNLGHAHPEITRSIREQAEKLLHCSNIYHIENQSVLAELIAQKSLGGKSFFANSGAEANEAAIKLARYYGNHLKAGKNKIISLHNSFHGRTIASLTMTGQPKYRQGYEPLPGNFVYVHENDESELEAEADESTCAIVLEIIQGESGVHPMTESFVKKARELCDKHDALLIIDEIQTGMGRTGKWFAYQHYDVTPDIITLAKALANGIPIGAMHAGDKVKDVLVPKSHGSTFGGNPFATAVAITVFQEMEKGVVDAVEAKGEQFRKGLKDLQQKFSFITEVRGKGLMVGLGMDQVAQKAYQACISEQLLLGAIGEEALRFLPPLIIESREIELALEKLAKAFATI